jgi:hypothetical protein
MFDSPILMVVYIAGFVALIRLRGSRSNQDQITYHFCIGPNDRLLCCFCRISQIRAFRFCAHPDKMAENFMKIH